MASPAGCSPAADRYTIPMAGKCASPEYVMDITERKRVEEALQKSEEKYRTLFQSIVEGFCLIEVLFDDDLRPNDYLFLEISPSFESQNRFEKCARKGSANWRRSTNRGGSRYSAMSH